MNGLTMLFQSLAIEGSNEKYQSRADAVSVLGNKTAIWSKLSPNGCSVLMTVWTWLLGFSVPSKRSIFGILNRSGSLTLGPSNNSSRSKV